MIFCHAFGGRDSLIKSEVSRNPSSSPCRENKSQLTNLTLAVHERVDSRFLVLPVVNGHFTDIIELIYFSPLKTCIEFNYKSEGTYFTSGSYHEPILFLWKQKKHVHFTTRRRLAVNFHFERSLKMVNSRRFRGQYSHHTGICLEYDHSKVCQK